MKQKKNPDTDDMTVSQALKALRIVEAVYVTFNVDEDDMWTVRVPKIEIEEKLRTRLQYDDGVIRAFVRDNVLYIN